MFPIIICRPNKETYLNLLKPRVFVNTNSNLNLYQIGLLVHLIKFLLSCFISGLKVHISHEAHALQPINLMHAIDLTKLQEDKYSEIRKY